MVCLHEQTLWQVPGVLAVDDDVGGGGGGARVGFDGVLADTKQNAWFRQAHTACVVADEMLSKTFKKTRSKPQPQVAQASNTYD